ncbi:transposable element Tcb2 transposase [Trichonephila clavipes]|nr:transposable element Tcb2 transposase [Trichonephila clavipes]
MQVWKQWTDEHRTTRKPGSGRRKVTSACDDRRLLRMTVNDCTASSRQLAARWSTVIGVPMSTLSIRRRLLPRGLRAKQDNARLDVAKTVRDLCSAQRMQLLPWPTYYPDMSLIEPGWYLVGWHLSGEPRPAASKDELLLRIQAVWNSLLQADIQNMFDSMSRSIAALIEARGGYTHQILISNT